MGLLLLRYFNFEPSFKLQWCRARDLFRSQIAVTTGGFELRISGIHSRCMQEICSSNPPVITGICDPNKISNTVPLRVVISYKRESFFGEMNTFF